MNAQPFECPRCGASNDEEAGLMCIPVEDECPMTVHEDWDEAAAIVRKQFAAAALGSTQPTIQTQE